MFTCYMFISQRIKESLPNTNQPYLMYLTIIVAFCFAGMVIVILERNAKTGVKFALVITQAATILCAILAFQDSVNTKTQANLPQKEAAVKN